MQISATPIKWTIPFAANDSAKVEIPATTADPTRFSLSLGSPPLTGQPPESGGVPPQLEDFNGAVNQVARFAWWTMGGGPLPFDATWSADPNVNGYANGAMIPAADGLGDWISTVDNNLINPDTVGTGWVPGYNYGSLALTGQTGGTVTLTPAQAVKRSMSVAGALTSNLTIVVPAWILEWSVTNTTTGAFTVTVKTAAGSGVVIPQNSSPTPVKGDGTNVTQLAQNIAQATSGTQAVRLDQMIGRLLGVQTFTSSGTYTPTPGTTKIVVEVIGGGGAGGGATTTTSTQVSMGSGGASGSYARASIASGFSGATVTVGAAGAATAGAAGGSGGQSSFGALVLAPGGGGGQIATVSSTSTSLQSAGQGLSGGAPTFTGAGTTQLISSWGQPGPQGLAVGNAGFSGQGAPSAWGGGAGNNAGAPGAVAHSPGAGGAGGFNGVSGGTAWAGGVGAAGQVLVYEYA